MLSTQAKQNLAPAFLQSLLLTDPFIFTFRAPAVQNFLSVPESTVAFSGFIVFVHYIAGAWVLHLSHSHSHLSHSPVTWLLRVTFPFRFQFQVSLRGVSSELLPSDLDLLLCNSVTPHTSSQKSFLCIYCFLYLYPLWLPILSFLVLHGIPSGNKVIWGTLLRMLLVKV